MGSTYIKLPEEFNERNIVGQKKISQYSLMQFVPGKVISVVTSQVENKDYGGNEERIGSIVAYPYVGNLGIQKSSMSGEESRYYPLLRGMCDIPLEGDPVLLCTIGERNYYLGPLNTEGDPNHNFNPYEGNELTTDSVEYKQNYFIKAPFKRLQKLKNPILDAPRNDSEDLHYDNIHGDLLLEGRHGNSLRIGSRNINPYIILSNGRAEHQFVESSLDSNILSMTSQGTLRNHFPIDIKGKEVRQQDIENKSQEELQQELRYNFTLADDEVDTVHRSISKTFKTSLGRGLGPHPTNGRNPVPNASGIDDEDIEQTINGYDRPQTFLSSDRIIFNARKDSMFLASKQFIHMGAGNTMTFSSNNTCLFTAATRWRIEDTPLVEIFSTADVVIDGRNKIVLGSYIHDDYINKAVMGESLVTYLATIVQEIKNMCYATAMSIEQSNKPGAALSNMKKVADGFDEILGMELVEDEENQISYEWPKTLADVILSNKVFIKK